MSRKRVGNADMPVVKTMSFQESLLFIQLAQWMLMGGGSQEVVETGVLLTRHLQVHDLPDHKSWQKLFTQSVLNSCGRVVLKQNRPMKDRCDGRVSGLGVNWGHGTTMSQRPPAISCE